MLNNERYYYSTYSAELDEMIHAELGPIADALIERKQKITAAESLTGGLMSAYFVDMPGCSEWFSEGFVVYSAEAKIDRLGVSSELIEKNTMLDSEVALEMAKGALRITGCDYSVAMCGLGGPFFHSDGTPIPMDPRHSPGLTFVACACKHGAAVHTYTLMGSRPEIRRLAVLKAVRMLSNMMQLG